MCEALSDIPGLKSIYQIGSISTPGISDIDLVSIFGDGEQVLANPRSAISLQALNFFSIQFTLVNFKDFTVEVFEIVKE